MFIYQRVCVQQTAPSRRFLTIKSSYVIYGAVRSPIYVLNLKFSYVWLSRTAAGWFRSECQLGHRVLKHEWSERQHNTYGTSYFT